jgi:hypothetical protein
MILMKVKKVILTKHLIGAYNVDGLGFKGYPI